MKERYLKWLIEKEECDKRMELFLIFDLKIGSGSSLIPILSRSSLMWSPGAGPSRHGFKRILKGNPF